MSYIKHEIISGDVYEAIQTMSTRNRKKGNRKPKNSKSTYKQILNNEKNAKRKVAREINANFKKGDLFITLTHDGEIPSLEDAKKALVNFFRRIKYFRKKNNLPDVKYIAVTESDEKRVHHHIIMSNMSMDIVNDTWNKGRTLASRLNTDRDYTGIAKYITKETPKAFAKRWTQSKNLKKPIVRTRELKSGRSVLKEPKGYLLLEQRLDYTDWTGNYQYLKAVKIGGMDYCEGWQDSDRAGTNVSQGISKLHNQQNKKPDKIQKSENNSGRTSIRQPGRGQKICGVGDP